MVAEPGTMCWSMRWLYTGMVGGPRIHIRIRIESNLLPSHLKAAAKLGEKSTLEPSDSRLPPFPNISRCVQQRKRENLRRFGIKSGRYRRSLKANILQVKRILGHRDNRLQAKLSSKQSSRKGDETSAVRHIPQAPSALFFKANQALGLLSYYSRYELLFTHGPC